MKAIREQEFDGDQVEDMIMSEPEAIEDLEQENPNQYQVHLSSVGDSGRIHSVPILNNVVGLDFGISFPANDVRRKLSQRIDFENDQLVIY